MINKYIELHEKFIDLIVKYHNEHTYFINRPSPWTARNLIPVVHEMSRVIKEMKKNNVKMRKDMYEEVKAKKKLKNSKEK